MSINKVIICGNIGKDTEVKYTASQIPVAQFSVAINSRVKRGNNYGNKTNWINCVMFQNRAEKLAQYLKKGVKVAIEGHLSVSSWQADDGTLRSKTEVIVDNIEFMNAREQGNTQQQPQQQQQNYQQQPSQQQPVQQAQQQVAGGYYDEDIPF